MRIDLTGQLRIEDGERVLDESALPGRQGRVVLARLALDPQPIHRDILADTLWPDGPPATWERTLSGVISRLRSAFEKAGLPDVSIANAFGCYELQLPLGAEIDVRLAAACASEAERSQAVGDLASARSAAGEAVAIARRPLLAGEDAPWLQLERDELNGVLVRALDVLAAATLGTGEALDAAREAVEIDPFRESAHVLLMRAHAALGNTAEALLAYERCRELLADELGIDPSPATRSLHGALLKADDDALLLDLSAQGLANLPVTLTTFVGRTGALAEVLEAFAGGRVLTLTGPGGVGKTRLAIEAARSAIASFSDGVFFIDLAGLTSSSPLGDHVAFALGLRLPGADADAIARVIDTQRLLLIFDNCEHVVDAAADFVHTLATKTTTPVIVATSRERLAVEGERVCPVPPLSVPEPHEGFEAVSGAESVDLFCARAAVVRPGFVLTSANADHVASICRTVEGVPLAIELAAARVAVMSVAEIAERLGDRIERLGGGAGPARQRTLQAAIDWSYDLLGPREAIAFRCCAVFEGWFGDEDAHAVCGGDVGGELRSLARRSLVIADGSSDVPRFRMLETIKQYGRDRMATTDELDALLDRHIDRYLNVVRRIGDSTEVSAIVDDLAHVSTDATAALDRALERGRISDASALAGVLAVFWHARGLLIEGRSALERVLDASERAGIQALHPVLGLAVIAGNQGAYEESATLARRGADLAASVGDDRSGASALASLSLALLVTGRLDEFSTCVEEARVLAEASGNHTAAASAYQYLAGAHYQSDAGACRRYAELSLEYFTKAGHRSGMARGLLLLSEIGAPESPRDDWRDLRERALELARQNGDRLTEGIVLGATGHQLIFDGNIIEGVPLLTRGMTFLRRAGDRRALIKCFEALADVQLEHGDRACALTMYTAIERLRSEVGVALSDKDVDVVQGRLERARNAAGDAAAAAAAEGAGLSFEDLFTLAMTAPTRTAEVRAEA